MYLGKFLGRAVSHPSPPSQSASICNSVFCQLISLDLQLEMVLYSKYAKLLIQRHFIEQYKRGLVQSDSYKK